MESGAAAPSGFADISRGDPSVQYALQTSIISSAGLVPHPEKSVHLVSEIRYGEISVTDPLLCRSQRFDSSKSRDAVHKMPLYIILIVRVLVCRCEVQRPAFYTKNFHSSPSESLPILSLKSGERSSFGSVLSTQIIVPVNSTYGRS